MKPVSPVIPDKNLTEVVIAENQDEYQNLPAVRLEGGIILCRWKLDEEKESAFLKQAIFIFCSGRAAIS